MVQNLFGEGGNDSKKFVTAKGGGGFCKPLLSLPKNPVLCCNSAGLCGGVWPPPPARHRVDDEVGARGGGLAAGREPLHVE
jgi:hypothetical protein